MSLTPAQILADELGQVGLKPGANQNAIKSAVSRAFPNGLATSQIDPRTGLPYTTATAKDAGSGNLAGSIIGGALLGYTVGSVVSGLGELGSVAGVEGATGAGSIAGPTAAEVNAATGATTAAETAGAAGAGDAAAGGAAAAGAGAAGAAVAAGTAVGAISAIWQWLTTPAHWLRILEYIAGAVLIYIAVSRLAGGPSVSTVVKEVAR